MSDVIHEFIREMLVEVGLVHAAALAGLLGTSTISHTEDPQPHPAPQKQHVVRLSPKRLAPIINHAARRYGVSPALVDAVIQTESGYNPNARSGVGAQGLMQLMPQTADWLGVNDPYDPLQNVMGGTKYLAYLLRTFRDDQKLAVAAYNAGPHRVKQHNGVPPYEETQAYVKRVLERVKTSTFSR